MAGDSLYHGCIQHFEKYDQKLLSIIYRHIIPIGFSPHQMFCLYSGVLNPLGTFGFLTIAKFPFANISVTWNFSEGKGSCLVDFF